MTFILVVDGGGSGCRLGLYDLQGKLLVKAADGPAQLSIDPDAAWANISSGIDKIRQQADLPGNWQPGSLFMGLAGSLHESRRKRFLELIPRNIPTQLVTDGHAQLIGATGGRAGACLSVGTGSVLHWLDDNGTVGMAGGWGFPAGDLGAGSWLGVHALIRFCEFVDTHSALGREVNTKTPVLFQLLAEQTGTSITEIQSWTTCKNPTELASLVPLIVKAELSGDKAAVELFDQGALQLKQLITYAPGNLSVTLAGGLATAYSSRLAQVLSDRLIEPKGDALDGLYLLAIADSL